MNKPFSKRTTIIILTVLFLLTAGLAYGLLALSQKDNILNWNTIITHRQPIVYEELKTDMDTSDWLEYKNDDWGLSFKYPKDWKAEQGLGEVILFPQNCPDVLIGEGGPMAKGWAITLEEPIPVVGTTLPQGVLDSIKKEDKQYLYQKVEGYKINKIVYISDTDGKQRTLAMVMANDKIIVTRTYNNCMSVADEPKFLDAILTTLKFYQ